MDQRVLVPRKICSPLSLRNCCSQEVASRGHKTLAGSLKCGRCYTNKEKTQESGKKTRKDFHPCTLAQQGALHLPCLFPQQVQHFSCHGHFSTLLWYSFWHRQCPLSPDPDVLEECHSSPARSPATQVFFRLSLFPHPLFSSSSSGLSEDKPLSAVKTLKSQSCRFRT